MTVVQKSCPGNSLMLSPLLFFFFVVVVIIDFPAL